MSLYRVLALGGMIIASVLPVQVSRSAGNAGGGAPVEAAGETNLLIVTATRPMVHSFAFGLMGEPNDGAFRIAFRITTAAGAIPFVALANSGIHVVEWRAFSSRGASCSIVEERLTGIQVFRASGFDVTHNLKQLSGERSSQSIARASVPLIATADFACDGRVRGGDRLTVHIRLWALAPTGWSAETFLFEELEVGGG